MDQTRAAGIPEIQNFTGFGPSVSTKILPQGVELFRAGPPVWDATPPFHQSEWIACEVIQIICFLTALYILYALLHFYIVQQSRQIYSGQSSGSRWLEKMCIAAVLCAIVRFANNQALLLSGWYTRERCSVLLNISIALYFVSLYPVYFFLWIRQRIFYSNRALKYLYNRVIRFVSWVTILFFIIVTAICMILLVVDRKNSASARVCKDHHATNLLIASGRVNVSGQEVNVTSEQKEGFRVNTLAGLLGSAIQTSFLVLFLYPIMDHKLRAVRNVNMKCHHSLMKLIRRAFVLSGVCIGTDIALAFGVKGVHALFPEADFALIVVYDINLIINIVCIIATFRRWRRMLFPWVYDCCGRSLGLQSTKTYFLQRRSTVGLNGSNVESFKISPKEPKSTNASDVWEVKVEKTPADDVLLDSEDEHSGEEENGEKSKKVTGENGNGIFSPDFLSRNGSKMYVTRRDLAVKKNEEPTSWSNGLKIVKRESPGIQREKNDAAKDRSNISRLKFSRSSLKGFSKTDNRAVSGFRGRRSYSLRKAGATPNFVNSFLRPRSKNSATVIRCEMLPEFTA